MRLSRAVTQTPILARAAAFARPARERLERFLLEQRSVASLLVALAIVAAVQEYLLGPKQMGDGVYAHFNNYRLYERAFRHLVAGRDLYVRYPAEHWDFFKYSPTFAAFMAPFSRCRTPLASCSGMSSTRLSSSPRSRRSPSYRRGARRSLASCSSPTS